MSTIEVGDLPYEYTVKFTGMTEYGISLEALMAGKVAPPPEGARFDVAFVAGLGRFAGPARCCARFRVGASLSRFELFLKEVFR